MKLNPLSLYSQRSRTTHTAKDIKKSLGRFIGGSGLGAYRIHKVALRLILLLTRILQEGLSIPFRVGPTGFMK